MRNMRQVVTFDAYGTLIDFRISDATRQILADRLPMDGVDTREFLDDFRVMRFQAVLEPYRSYRDVLRSSLQIAMRLHGIPQSPSDGDALIAAVPSFGPFPEVPDALRAVRSLGYEIAIISNTDDDLIRDNVARIGVDFDHVITAQQARAYKPSSQAFEHAYAAMDVPPAQVSHVAQGWEYDLIPTRDLGLRRRIWINRYRRPGSSLYQPYDELPDLSAVPVLLGTDASREAAT
jgi:2-haloacid dehalogenase